MVDLIARVTPAAEVAQAFLHTTHEQLRAAQSEEWGRVAELTDFRDILVERLAEITAGQLDELDRLTLVRSLTRVQELDDEIRRRANHESSRLQDEINELDRGRAVATGYGWTRVAGASKMLDRHG